MEEYVETQKFDVREFSSILIYCENNDIRNRNSQPMDYKKVIRSVLSNRNLSIPQKINQIKVLVESGDYKNALSHPVITSFLTKHPYFRSLDDIKIKEPFQFLGDFKKEFRWLAYIIENFLPQINDFCALKMDFESTVISGKYAEAQKILSNIEQEFGVSLWTIENNILLIDLTKGPEANWNLLSNYLTQINNSIYDFNISAGSKRVESNLSYESFLNQFQNDIDNIQASGLVKDYFVFQNFNIAEYEYEFKNLASVLYIANIFSVIDQYLIIIDVIIFNISKSPENDKVIANFIKVAKDKVPNDIRLVNINNVINQKKAFQNLSKNDSYLASLDLYCTGKFKESLQVSRSILLENPLEFEMYQIYCKSLINLDLEFISLNLGGMADQILLDTYKLLCFQKSDEDCIKRLLKSSLLLMNFNIGKQIFALVSEIEGSYDWQYFTGILSTSFTSPKNTKFKLSRDYAVQNLKEVSTLPCFRVYSYIENIDNALGNIVFASEVQSKFVHASGAFKSGNFQLTLDLLNSLQEPIHAYYLERKNTLIYFCYLHLNKIKDALILLSSVLFDNDLVYRKIDYLALYHKIKSAPDKTEFVSLIELSILYSLLVKEYDLFEVYDDFMLSLDADSVRDLKVEEMITRFGKLKTVHFLEKVVTVDTLKYNTDYSSISDVEEDRIYILGILVGLNPINKQIYEKERDEIYRASSVRKVLKEVDEGRLYIDVNSLKDLQVKKFLDDFKRYKEIEYSSTTQLLKGFNPYNTKNWDKALIEKNETSDLYNSADYLAFKSIYLESRDNFLFSKEYGLDSCLSTRIRHGALKNHIRSVFEKLNLVSSKTKETYNDNFVWRNQLNQYPELESIVQARLKLFSKQIDDYTAYIRDSLIQIQTEKQPEKKDGLFAYFTGDELLFNFYSEHKDLLISVDKAIEIILTQLVNYTLIFLQKTVTDTFSNDISNYFQTLIESTVADLRKLDLPSECQLITNLTKSSTDIGQELEYLSEWFYLNTTSSSSLLSINTLLDASLNLTNRINPLFNLVPNVNSKKEFAGYSSLIFVFNILLNNVIAHSHLNPQDIILDVTADVTDDEKYVYVSFSNNVNPDVSYSANKKKLAKVKENWNNHENIERSNKEGESGYDKIKRILLYEALAKSDRFDFSFNDNKVSITLFFPYNKPISDAQTVDN